MFVSLMTKDVLVQVLNSLLVSSFNCSYICVLTVFIQCLLRYYYIWFYFNVSANVV